MNNVRWAWHSLIMADVVFHTFCTRKTSSVCPLITAKVVPLQWISHFWNIHDVLPFTYQTHDLIVVVQTETFQRHTDWAQTNKPRGEKKKTEKKKQNRERQREKGENSSAVHLADDILCTLSVISFSSARMDRISPLSLSGMTASLKSLETPFSSVSLAPLSLSLPLSGCHFPETLWISYNPFFFSSPPLLLSHLSLDANSTPASRQTVRLSVHLSVYSYPPPYPFFSSMPVWPKSSLGKIQDEIEKKKKLYRDIFFREKS